MADLSDIPDEAETAGASRIDDLLTMLGVDPNERPEHGGPTIAETVASAVLAAALPVLNTARDASPDVQTHDEYRRLWMHRFDTLLSNADVLDEDDQLAVLNVHEALLAEQYHNHRAALSFRQRVALVSGDIPITERTPHGVWIADGPDPEPSLAVPCGGPSGCDDCRAYNDLRQHLVEQITALDEQHQRETRQWIADEAGKREALMEMVAHRDTKIDELRQECDNLLTRLNEAHATVERLAGERVPFRGSETAEPELIMGTKPDDSPWVVSAEFAGPAVRVDGYGALRLYGKAIAPAAAHRLAKGLLAAIGWLENDGAAKAEADASLRDVQ